MTEERDKHTTSLQPSAQVLPELSRFQSNYSLQGDHSEIVLHRYWKIVRKNIWIIAAVTLGIVSIVAIATFKMAPVYTAAARIEIEREDPVLAQIPAMSSQTLPWDAERYIETRAEVLRSETLAMRTIAELGLEEAPEFLRFAQRDGAKRVDSKKKEQATQKPALVDEFLSRLRVTPNRRSYLLQVEFEANDPTLAANVVNTHINNFIEHNFETRYEATVQASQWMTKQLEDLKIQVEISEDALVAYERANQIWTIGEKQNITTQTLSDLNQQLTIAQGELIRQKSLYEQSRGSSIDTVPAVLDSRFIQNLVSRKLELKDRHTEALNRFGPKYPEVVRLEARLQEASETLRKQKQNIVDRIESEYYATKQREELLRSALEQQKQITATLAEKFVQHNILKREADSNKQLYEGLLQRLKEAGVRAGLRSSNIHVVDRALVPTRPTRPQKALNIVLAIFVGLFGGVLIAFVREYLDRTVKTVNDAEVLTDLPALAIIPGLGSGRSNGISDGRFRWIRGSLKKAKTEGGSLVAVEQPRSLISEAYRSLRTQILLSRSKHPPRVILVTSPLPTEGKTTVAANLGITFAQLGDKTLIIEADMRRPALMRTLGCAHNGGRGLVDCLSGLCSVQEAIVPVPKIPNLSVLHSGVTPPNPAELLASSVLSDTLSTLKESYKYIILDSPPILFATDAVIMATVTDALLLVVRSGTTTRHSLLRACDILDRVDGLPTGLVINDVDLKGESLAYYDYDDGYYARSRNEDGPSEGANSGMSSNPKPPDTTAGNPGNGSQEKSA